MSRIVTIDRAILSMLVSSQHRDAYNSLRSSSGRMTNLTMRISRGSKGIIQSKITWTEARPLAMTGGCIIIRVHGVHCDLKIHLVMPSLRENIALQQTLEDLHDLITHLLCRNGPTKIGGAQPKAAQRRFVEYLAHGRLDRLRVLLAAERVAEEHRGAEDSADGVGDPAACDVGR